MIHVGKTMPFLPPIFLGMVNIPPIKMVIFLGDGFNVLLAETGSGVCHDILVGRGSFEW